MVIDQSGNELKQVWHSQEFDAWLALLSSYSARQFGDPEYCETEIVTALKSFFRKSSGWVKSSFIPGKDWTGTPYQPIYDCLGDGSDEAQWDVARKFFGVFVCHALMTSEGEVWEAQPKVNKEDGMLYRRAR